MDFNGVIYSKYPVRLSNAESLPGENSGGKKAVFTLITEESLYLKGNYNTGAADPDNWKISHIASKKKIYTLSNAFNDPASPPDFAIYNEYRKLSVYHGLPGPVLVTHPSLQYN